jgi:alpha-L-rhamnosidase
MRLKTKLLLFFQIFSFLLCCKNSSFESLRILKLTCEYAENPITVGTKNPRFGWILSSTIQGQKQQAYQILVADSEDKINQNLGNLWNSNKQFSSQSIQILYTGKPLISNQTYYWKVKIWGTKNHSEITSDIVTFHTALMEEKNWIAKWIGDDPEIEPLPSNGFFQSKKEQYTLSDTIMHKGGSLLLRKEIELPQTIKSAFAYTSGLGYYEFYINGTKVGDHVLVPAKTNYRKEVLYDTYEVSTLLKKGKNVLGLFLGNGWFNPYKKWWQPYRMQWFGSKRAILQIHVEFESGETAILKTDETWKIAPGPILFNCIYDGEIYDATREQANWNTTDFDDSNWQPAKVKSSPGGEMRSQDMPPIKVVQTIKPERIYTPKESVFVYDMGQNFAGWVKFTGEGPPKTKILLRFAEDLHEDGNINTTSNERAQATATYIMKGGGDIENYEPRFTFYGFRYLELSGFPGQPTLDNVKGCVVHSANPPIGEFECDNELINSIHRATVWSQKSNMMGYPLDCPQRDERLGWMGDAQVTAEEAMFNFDMALFYQNWLNGIRLNQDRATGDIPIISPRPYIQDEGVEWSSTYILLAWNYYLYYGDKQILEHHYPSMKQYIQFLLSVSNNFIIKKGWIGDWGSLVEGWEEGDPELVPSAFFFYNAKIMGKIASVLGKEEDAYYFRQLEGNIQSAFNKKFFNSDVQQYLDGSQFANGFPLFLGMVEEKYREGVLNNLIIDIAKNNYHLTTGVLGSKYVPEVLAKNGRCDIVYRLITQTGYPGWAHMVENRTTLSEFWNLKQSHNHVMMGSIDAWFYKYLAGIQVDESQPGFERIIIKPYIPESLNFVRARVNSIRGLIQSEWEKQKDFLYITVSIPVNAVGEIWIPVSQNQKIYESGQPVSENPEIIWSKRESNYIVFNLASGSYKFEVR